jgi:outer membrane protein TolC
MAQVRLQVGFSGRADVLRWESALATTRKTAIEVNAVRNVAEIEFNRVLHRPLEESFELEESAIDDPNIIAGLYPYLPYFRDKLTFQRAREFLVQEAYRYSPELKQLDATLAALDRNLSAATRSYYLPTLVLDAGVDHRFSRSGAGSDPPSDFPIPVPDDTDWNVALVLNYPLLEGGGRIAERRRALEELRSVEAEREAVAEFVEQRVRSALHVAGASFAGIEQATLAADAARGNLDLITESYSQGQVSVIELLDAQNSYIVAAQSRADAIFGFLRDMIEVQRALGQFEFMRTPEEQDDFARRLDAFMAAGDR